MPRSSIPPGPGSVKANSIATAIFTAFLLFLARYRGRVTAWLQRSFLALAAVMQSLPGTARGQQQAPQLLRSSSTGCYGRLAYQPPRSSPQIAVFPALPQQQVVACAATPASAPETASALGSDPSALQPKSNGAQPSDAAQALDAVPLDSEVSRRFCLSFL